MTIKNSQGSIYYGLHFYPGVAQYKDEDSSQMVFINEDTIRSMDHTFKARPVFVYHVEDVSSNLNVLRNEADGWVIESFFNEADGKHWVKFIVVSDKGESAVKRGMKLSNAYKALSFGSSGVWNGIDYEKEITSGEFEHLAIVPNPRYEESIILTPEQYKKYCEDKKSELTRFANDNTQGKSKMKFSFFKREKVENSKELDLASLSVLLPNSKKEVDISKLINDADEKEMEKDKPIIAHADHLVQVGKDTMKVGELVNMYQDMMTKKKDDERETENDDDSSASDDDTENDADAGDKALEEKVEHEKKQNAVEEKRKAKEKADRLRNAPKNVKNDSEETIMLSGDQVALGKSRYGR